MNDSAFIAASICICVASVFGFLYASSVKENEAIVKLVGDGADPIKASCAISGWSSSTGRSMVCLQAASK
jgi:hypothetical protein